jgi:small subunit ribosomal protein S1
MTQSFAELFEESLLTVEMAPGSIVTGIVVDIDSEWVTVHAGLKSEGVIPRAQFLTESGEFNVNIGDEVKVALDAVEDGFGETKLSREKAKRAETWAVLEKAYEEGAIVNGVINGKVKGGFTVDIANIRAFLPGSLVDVRPIRDTSHLEGVDLEFKLIKLDQKRNNVVVSRRAVMEATNSAERETLLASLEEGQEVKGIVKNLTDYGAFVDLGGIDGLLHITDMAWKRVKHPSEVVNVGDEIPVKVLKFDRERTRVSLGMKQLGEDPWVAIANRYPEGAKLTGRVTNLTDYGCFVEIQEGVEGLVHVSEMDWTNKNVHPSKVVQLGDEVDVMLLDIDKERRRISLGMKQCTPNPWQTFSEQFTKGDRVSGVIRSITDFGIFVGMDGGIDGLVHESDLSWDDSDKDAVKRFKKGDEVEAVILSIDSERERIALGIKQLDGDPFSEYTSTKSKGETVKGSVSEITSKGLVLTLAEGVEGSVRIAEVSRERVDNLSSLYSIGDEVEAMVINIDRRSRVIALSIKQLEIAQEKKAMDSVSQQSDTDLSGPTTIGDLIKAQMKKIDSK